MLLCLLAITIPCAPSCGGELPDGTAGLETLESAALAGGQVVNGIQWADLSGNPIHAHGGGLVRAGSSYYWFGENRNADSTFKEVSCYRSSDLRSWQYCGAALSSTSATELHGANVERPKVVYNAATGKYVMWMHWENGTNYGEARAAVAYSSTVEGPYTYVKSFRPYAGRGVSDHGKDGYMSRDCNLFVDSDGAGYFISSSNENMDLHLYRLTSDYLGVDSLVTKLFVGSQREAPVLFKRNGVYFLLTSACTSWSPNQAKYATSTNLAGQWSSLQNVGDGNSYYSQPTSVLAIQGSGTTSYLYAGDRWAGAWSGPYLDSMYVWLPITFPSNTSMSLAWSNTVTINAASGQISGANNSFVFTNKNSGKVLEVMSASAANNAAVDQHAWSGGTHQRWNLNYDGAGYFRLTNVNSGKVLDVPSASTADGTRLIQYTGNGGNNQKWRLVDLGSGSFQLRNKDSGKVAETAESSTADAAVVDQQSWSGGPHQIWKMTIP